MNKNDRCDSCGAQAINRFSRPDSPDTDLLFCNHHTTKFIVNLTRQGFVAVQSAELVEA